MIQETLREAIIAVHADACTVHLRDPERPLVRLVALQGAVPQEQLASIRDVAWGRGLFGSTAALGDPRVAPDALGTTIEDPWLGSTLDWSEVWMCVPMVLGQELVGVLGVRRTGNQGPSSADLRALAAGAHAAARHLAPSPLAQLRQLLLGRLDEGARGWLLSSLEGARRGDLEMVRRAFREASARTGLSSLGSSSALVLPHTEVPLRSWRVDDAARTALALALPRPATTLLRELYCAGDLREREGALRALAAVGSGQEALDVVIEACGASPLGLFEAAIQDNPYTTRVLPDAELRRAVLRCAYLRLPLDRIAELDRRVDPALSRMLLWFVRDCDSSFRSVSSDVWSVLALHPLPGLLPRLLISLEDRTQEERLAAARAIALTADARARPFLEDRLTRERSDAVRSAVVCALASLTVV